MDSFWNFHARLRIGLDWTGFGFFGVDLLLLLLLLLLFAISCDVRDAAIEDCFVWGGRWCGVVWCGVVFERRMMVR